jgi:hypothetical protein
MDWTNAAQEVLKWGTMAVVVGGVAYAGFKKEVPRQQSDNTKAFVARLKADCLEREGRELLKKAATRPTSTKGPSKKSNNVYQLRK